MSIIQPYDTFSNQLFNSRVTELWETILFLSQVSFMRTNPHIHVDIKHTCYPSAFILTTMLSISSLQHSLQIEYTKPHRRRVCGEIESEIFKTENTLCQYCQYCGYLSKLHIWTRCGSQVGKPTSWFPMSEVFGLNRDSLKTMRYKIYTFQYLV